MERIGHFTKLSVQETLGAEDPWHYRNKMQVPAAQGRNHTLAIGCYAQGTHRVIDVKDCLIQQQANNRIVQVVRSWMENTGSRPWKKMPAGASSATLWDGWGSRPEKSWPCW